MRVPVEALAVANSGVLPGERQQDTPQLLQGGAGGGREVLISGQGAVEVQLDLSGSRMRRRAALLTQLKT